MTCAGRKVRKRPLSKCAKHICSIQNVRLGKCAGVIALQGRRDELSYYLQMQPVPIVGDSRLHIDRLTCSRSGHPDLRAAPCTTHCARGGPVK